MKKIKKYNLLICFYILFSGLLMGCGSPYPESPAESTEKVLEKSPEQLFLLNGKLYDEKLDEVIIAE